MFVQPSRLLTQGACTLLGMLAIGACDAPVNSTDLRPEGDPEVLTVMVFNDAVDGVLEQATFCRVGDNKRPGFVGISSVGLSEQVCDDDVNVPATTVTDAVPTGWYARVMFDELLDPNVEELTELVDPDTNQPTGQFEGHIKNTKPVTLKCAGADVPYDGYYSPSGNAVTWPVGPSLFIQPQDLSTIATSSECTLSVNDIVTDKDGNKVPTAQAADPNYKWNVAALELVATDPAAAEAGDPPPEVVVGGTVILAFNAFMADSIEDAEIVLKEGTDCTTAAAGTVKAGSTSAADPDDPTALDVTLAGLTAGKTYFLSFTPDAMVTDSAGGTAALPAIDLCFTAVAP